MWQTILFDLDGTLTDPGEGITKAVAYALGQFGISVQDRRTLTKFIGPPLEEAFPEYYGFSEAQTETAIAQFRVYYNETGWLENVPYPGIHAMLQSLRQAGKKLLVATSKPEQTARQVLEHFKLSAYFNVICGAPLDDAAAGKKAAVIRRALQRAGLQPGLQMVMVGDRRHDMLGAKAVGLAALGVLYGYGDRQELSQAGADFLASDIAMLQRLLLGET